MTVKAESIRTDLSAALCLTALNDKVKYIRRNGRADAMHAFNHAQTSWAQYSATYGRAFELLQQAERAESAARVALDDAMGALSDARELSDPTERDTAIAAATAARTDARRAMGKAADVAATLRDKLGDDVITDFDEYEESLWAAVEAQDAKITEVEAIADKVRDLRASGEEITSDEAARWATLCGGLPLLLESTRQREQRKASGERGKASRVTASELDDLAALLAE